jgi:acyl carrier protein
MNKASIDSGDLPVRLAPSKSCDVSGIVRDFVLSNYLFGDRSELGDDTSLVDSGILDSTGVLELVSFLEEHFQIVVQDHEMIPANLDSVSAISGFLRRKIQ